MRGFLNDLAVSARTLRRHKLLCAAIVLSLALGLGAADAIFRVLDAAFLRQLPYPRAEALVRLSMTSFESGEQEGPVSRPDFEDWRREADSFDALAAISIESVVITELDHPSRLAAARVTADYFELLAPSPRAGAVPMEAWTAGRPLVAVSHDFWRTRLGATSDLSHRVLVLDGEPHEVVAVMPSWLAYPPSAELLLPLPADAGAGVRDGRFLTVLARRAPGVSAQEAAEEMARLASHLEADHRETNAGLGIAVEPLHEVVVGDVGKRLSLILGAAACVFLVICTNIASLLMARASGRRSELRLRLALGSGRRQLLRLLLAESLLLAGLGMALGSLLGLAGSRLLVAIYPEPLLALGPLGWSPSILVFEASILAMATVLFVAGPALHVLQLGGDGPLFDRATRAIHRGQGAVLVAQVASTLVLLVCAGLMLQSLYRLGRVDPGFEPEEVWTARVALPPNRYEPPERAAFFARLLEELRASGSLATVSGVTHPPLSGSNMRFKLRLPGREDPNGEPLFANYRAVSSDYFRSLGVPLLLGRDITPRDDLEAPAVALVNQEFARRYFGGAEAVGERLQLLFRSDEPRTVIGVVGDIHHFGPGTPAQPEVYVPYGQHTWPFLTLVFEPRTSVDDALAALRLAVARQDASQPLDRIASLARGLDQTTGEPRFQGLLVASFASTALAVAMIGIFGVTSYWNARRRSEVGLRLALGARRGEVVRLLMRQPLALVALGTVLGAVGMGFAARALEGRLFGVEPFSPLTFCGVGGLLLIVAFFAALIPSRLAARLDPHLLLKDD